MAVSGSTERSERYFKGFAPGVLEGWSLKVIRILDGCSSRIYVKDEDSPVFQKVHEIDELTIGFEDPYSDSSLKRLRRSLRNLEKLDLKSGDGNLLQLFPRFEDYWNKKFRATLDRPVISKKLFENLVILGLEASRFEIKEKNQPTIEYLEEYWDKVVLQGIGSHLFDKNIVNELI